MMTTKQTYNPKYLIENQEKLKALKIKRLEKYSNKLKESV
jgi:hypothetical protein